jgi:hypothetical protein
VCTHAHARSYTCMEALSRVKCPYTFASTGLRGTTHTATITCDLRTPGSMTLNSFCAATCVADVAARMRPSVPDPLALCTAAEAARGRVGSVADRSSTAVELVSMGEEGGCLPLPMVAADDGNPREASPSPRLGEAPGRGGSASTLAAAEDASGRAECTPLWEGPPCQLDRLFFGA